MPGINAKSDEAREELMKLLTWKGAPENMRQEFVSYTEDCYIDDMHQLVYRWLAFHRGWRMSREALQFE